MRNEVVGLSKIYGSKPWTLQRSVQGAGPGELVWCVRVERRGKQKDFATVLRIGENEVRCRADPEDLFIEPEVEVWRQHLARRQWMIEGRRFYLIDFQKKYKLLALSEEDGKIPPLARKAIRVSNKVADLEDYSALQDVVNSLRSQLPSWSTHQIHARITGDDPSAWPDESDREAAWDNQWFIYGVRYQELIACDQDPTSSRPMTHDEASTLWEDGWSRSQFDV